MGRRGRHRNKGYVIPHEGDGYNFRQHSPDEPTDPIARTTKLIHGPWEKDGHGPVEVHRGPATGAGGWSTGEEPMDLCAKDCSWFDKNGQQKISMLFKSKVGDAISYLLDNVPIEWQLILIGEVIVDGDKEVVIATDYYIPKQEVGPASVKNLDCIDKKFIEEKRAIGTIHSHVDMRAFFSGTDQRECNSSPLLYHVVINKRYEYEAVKQVKLACGLRKFAKMNVAFEKTPVPRPIGFDNIVPAYGGVGGALTFEGWQVGKGYKAPERVPVLDKRVRDITQGVNREFWD